MFKLTLLPVTLASVAVALSGTNNNNPPTLGNAAIDTNAVEIQSIQAHFQNAGIVPAGLPAFDPSAIMVADYTGVGNISPGQSLTRAQVGPAPTFTITPANSSVSLTGSYTLAMVDFDHVGADQSGGVTRHWLVNGVTIDGSSISNASATAITAYAGPAPPEGTGPHRYAFLLWAQPESFTAPEGLNAPIGVTKFDVNAYARWIGSSRGWHLHYR
ncbi:hypothetical protein ONZ45_g19358 [Pleurotus djamor]|nr:hypothetical protein ONZ45_g19358 [Pleurotus djamor]